MNAVLSNLKTAIPGTYHAFKFAKYAERYLAEVRYRFNRRFDLSVILVRLMRAAVLTRHRPEPVSDWLRLGANQVMSWVFQYGDCLGIMYWFDRESNHAG